ncbi:MAG: baseplate J/gp47 family protein [Ruminococcus sp.]|nr:baseplate J/gp47 family protein [Ruminococcus sp.]
MLSYEEILNRMVEKYEELSGFSINSESDIMLRLKVLAGEIYNSTTACEFLKRQMFLSTASGEYLDKHAFTRGLYRKQAVKAKGEVTFYRSVINSTDVVIQKGTVVSTAGPQIRQFVTLETVTMLKDTGSVTAKAQAIEGGASYNVIKDTVTVLVTPPIGVTGVKNQMAFTGGSDEESDEELRERVLYSYRDISNGTNAVYYKRLAESVEGVYSASIVSRARGAGTLNVYVCGKGEEASLNKEHIEKVQKVLDENRELNVDILVVYALPLKVSFNLNLCVKDGYSFDEVSAEITQKLRDYIDSLGVGRPALLCEMGEIIFHTQGVKNYEFIDAFCNDVFPQPNEYLRLTEVDIRQVER